MEMRRLQADKGIYFRLVVIPAEAGIQNENLKEKISGYPLSRV
jgi:hypothetical protein